MPLVSRHLISNQNTSDLHHYNHYNDPFQKGMKRLKKNGLKQSMTNGYGSIPINTIFRGGNIHLPAILMFTRYQGFDPSPNQGHWFVSRFTFFWPPRGANFVPFRSVTHCCHLRNDRKGVLDLSVEEHWHFTPFY